RTVILTPRRQSIDAGPPASVGSVRRRSLICAGRARTVPPVSLGTALASGVTHSWEHSDLLSDPSDLPSDPKEGVTPDARARHPRGRRPSPPPPRGGPRLPPARGPSSEPPPRSLSRRPADLRRDGGPPPRHARAVLLPRAAGTVSHDRAHHRRERDGQGAR